MELFKALILAEAAIGMLRPFCTRIDLAGGCRRKKAEPHDLEIVCIPNRLEILSFIQAVDSLGEVIKGSATGRYMQVRLPQQVNLDLFIARPENYGLIFAIRTGSAEFSHKVLATGWVKRGYKSIDGMLTFRGNPVQVREEKDLFKLIGMPWIEPEKRI